MYLKQVGQCPRGVLGCRGMQWQQLMRGSDGYMCLCAADGGRSDTGRT